MPLQNTREIILSYLQKKGECSRVELAKALGLTKATISSHTAQLISQGILIEKGETVLMDEDKPLPKRGRRTVSIEINKNYKLALGVVIFKEGICAGLTNLQGEILQKVWRYHENAGQQSLLELITATYNFLLNENCIEPQRLLAMSISVANGCEETCDGKSVSEQLLKLKRDLSHAISAKIVTCKLADGALLAHKIFLKENFSSAVMLMSGDPIDVGLFLNGDIYEGFFKQAGGISLLSEALCGANSENLETAQLLFEKIIELVEFIDPQVIYGIGEAFFDENFLAKLNDKFLQKEKKSNKTAKHFVKASYIKRETAFLSPCAQAVFLQAYDANF